MLAFPPASTPAAPSAILAAMASNSRLPQSWPVLAGAVAGVLAYAIAATIRPHTPAEDRLDTMQAEIDALRASLEEVDARARDAGRLADDLRFSLEHPQ